MIKLKDSLQVINVIVLGAICVKDVLDNVFFQ